MDCIFCDVVAGKSPKTVVYENDRVLVIKDKYPAAPLHWLIIPKKHAHDLSALSDHDAAELFVAAKKLILQHGISGYRIVNNGGGAQAVDHVHIHIMGLSKQPGSYKNGLVLG